MAAAGPPRLKVSLFGELTLSDGGVALPLPASRKTRALFVYLLLSGHAVRRERLCEVFFDIPDDPRAALRWSLSKIRSMLGRHAGCLVADRDRVELLAGGIDSDVQEAKALLAMPILAGADLVRFIDLTHAALDTPLAGLDLAGLDGYGAWLAAERSLIDDVRARLFAVAAVHKTFTPEQQQRFVREAEMLGRTITAASAMPAEAPARLHLVDAPSSVGLEQLVRYTFTPDGVRIAYACTGSGPPLVKAANWLNHLELDWEGPVWGRLFHELSADHMLVRYDERGNGFSDWEVQDLGFDAFVSDLECVVDKLGLERFPLLGISQGCAVSIATRTWIPSPTFSGSTIATRRWMTPLASSRWIRRQQGVWLRFTRAATSAIGSEAFSCRMARIFRSVWSKASRSFEFSRIGLCENRDRLANSSLYVSHPGEFTIRAAPHSNFHSNDLLRHRRSGESYSPKRATRTTNA